MESAARTFTNAFSSRLEEPVRAHLKNVYACLTMSTVTAALGAYIHMYTEILSAGFLTVLGAVGFLFALMSIPDDGKNRHLRVGFLFGFAFFSGMGLGPLLEIAVAINPQIIMTALVGTSVVFACFSVAALTAERGRWLYLGGTLMTLLSTLLLLSLANVLFGSKLLFQIYLYIGLFLMCGFVLYDTQLIIEKRRAGDRDFVIHSVDLFIDFIGIFRRLIIILAEKEDRKQRSKKE